MRLEEQPDGIRWYACVLHTDDTTILGYESRSYLLTHLRDALGAVTRQDGDVDGMPAQWLLSLAEMHKTLYVVEKPKRTIYVQGSNGELEGHFTLTSSDVNEWRDRLG